MSEVKLEGGERERSLTRNWSLLLEGVFPTREAAIPAVRPSHHTTRLEW